MYFLLTDESTSSSGSMITVLLVYAVFFVALYFILIRPQRKQQKKVESMQNAISIGDWVMLSNGMYGKVVNVINDNLMIEFGTNKSVIIPVRRDQISAVKEPDLTQKTVDEEAVPPKDDLVGEDLEEDGLDDYDKYLIEQGEKKGKKSPFKKKK